MKNWKKTLLSLTISVGMLVSAAPAMASSQHPALKVNNQEIEYASNAPIIEKGVTFVPLRTTFQALKVNLTDVNDESIHAVVKGKQITLNSNTKVINGVTYAPIRIIGEAAGYEVRWDQASRTVLLLSKETREGARGFLWEVKNNETTVYLVGSMHVADDSFYPLHPEMEKAFAEADYLGVEVDVNKAPDAKLQKLIMNYSVYKDGSTLKDHVSKDTYAKIGEILTKNDLNPDAFDTFKPWVVESAITNMKAMKAGYKGDVGIDLYFIQKSIERKIPVLELETYESQLEMFNGFSKELQEKNLNLTLNNFDEIDETVDEMADMWKTGDDQGLLEMTNSMLSDPEYGKAMLIDRNVGMVDKIDGYLKSNKKEEYFIVVGAGHYLSEHGIVKLLQDKGYTVVRK